MQATGTEKLFENIYISTGKTRKSLYVRIIILMQNPHNICMFRIKKVKVHPITGHEGPEREYRYSSTLSLILEPDGVGGQHHTLVALPPRKRPGTHCIGGWMGPRAGLDG